MNLRAKLDTVMNLLSAIAIAYLKRSIAGMQRYVRAMFSFPSCTSVTIYSVSVFLLYAVRWLQLRFDFDSAGDRRAFDCFPKVIKVTVM